MVKKEDIRAFRMNSIVATNGGTACAPLQSRALASFSLLHGPQTLRISFIFLSERFNARATHIQL
jgi:hypothetical protein